MAISEVKGHVCVKVDGWYCSELILYLCLLRLELTYDRYFVVPNTLTLYRHLMTTFLLLIRRHVSHRQLLLTVSNLMPLCVAI